MKHSMLRTHAESREQARRGRRLRGGPALALGVLCAGAQLTPGAGLAANVDFRRDVEPIFVKRCSECHGPDQQKGKLRLDARADAVRGGKSGPALVPGKSAASEIMRRVRSTDPEEVMPAKGERLTEEQVAILERWIDAGAVWPEADARAHWAFNPPRRPMPPAVKQRKWLRNDIDAFILARLEHEGLSANAEAERAVLLRRLYLDLVGLPPTPAEVDAFVRDAHRDAYERVVDRLLASKHYGEHIGRWWLDLARYADSNGYQVDLARSIWPYRDWVIEAFNRNQPFDRFTIEQLAGDLLPGASLEQRVATGFHRNSKINDEGGGDAEEYRTKAVKDRVATTATVWLGLTLACAECHSHKYDPLSQEDYYRFYAFFNNTADGGNNSLEPTVPVPARDTSARVASIRERVRVAQRELQAVEAALPQAQARWEQEALGRAGAWTLLSLTNAISTGGASYTNLPDGSILSTGVNPIYDTIQVEAETGVTNIRAVLLEVLPDPSLPKRGPGRWNQTGNFILDELVVSAEPVAPGNGAAQQVSFARATADWEQLYYRAEHAVDRNPKTGWAIGPRFGEPHHLIAEIKEPVGFAGGTRLKFRFEHYHGNSHTIGRMRLSLSSAPDALRIDPMPLQVAEVLAVPAAQRTAAQQAAVAAHLRRTAGAVRSLERRLYELNQRELDLARTAHSTPVMQERPDRRPTFVHRRGNFLDPGKEVQPGVPGVLPPLAEGAPADRLALARWLVNPGNPLTARVTVNRLWERFFGIGLVRTSEDFGRQGEAPSHPELLDWLATELMGSGWDLKALQKTLVMSATYRQSAACPPAALEKDPYNRWLARGSRFRLDAEVIRDQALAVSGLLNLEVGGPSVYPVQVPNLWKELGFLRPEIGMDEWPVSEGQDLYRRGVYTFWRRVCTYPTFATFDAPSRDVCTSRRLRTNTPLQALAALNEAGFMEAARVFAERILAEGGDSPAARADFAFRVCLARKPTRDERRRLVAFYEGQRREFARDPQAAHTLLAVGSAPRAANAALEDVAAWTMVANALLNLDETLTKG
jgi:mono/diheme cytochrome c family protein